MEAKSVPQEKAKPLYKQAMSYMAEHGEIGSRPSRRTVQRSLELDVQSEEDRAAFVASTTFTEIPGRRRPPLPSGPCWTLSSTRVCTLSPPLEGQVTLL